MFFLLIDITGEQTSKFSEIVHEILKFRLLYIYSSFVFLFITYFFCSYFHDHIVKLWSFFCFLLLQFLLYIVVLLDTLARVSNFLACFRHHDRSVDNHVHSCDHDHRYTNSESNLIVGFIIWDKVREY